MVGSEPRASNREHDDDDELRLRITITNYEHEIRSPMSDVGDGFLSISHRATIPARQGRAGLARGCAPGGRWFAAWSPQRGDRQVA